MTEDTGKIELKQRKELETRKKEEAIRKRTNCF
jgi:hypothetical protein